MNLFPDPNSHSQDTAAHERRLRNSRGSLPVLPVPDTEVTFVGNLPEVLPGTVFLPINRKFRPESCLTFRQSYWSRKTTLSSLDFAYALRLRENSATYIQYRNPIGFKPGSNPAE